MILTIPPLPVASSPRSRSVARAMLRRMTDEQPRGPDVAADLQYYLQRARTVMLSRLDGLGEYENRRHMTTTRPHLLGLVKHLAGIELSYIGYCVGHHSEIRI